LPNILAPRETGAQLLNLSRVDFEYRCQKCPAVKQEQAHVFRLKLWQLHIDSQHNESSKQNSKSKRSPALTSEGSNSSKELDPTRSKLPFKDRLRPGMVVSFKIPQDCKVSQGLPEGRKLAVLLCPVESSTGGDKPLSEHTIHHGEAERNGGGESGPVDGRRYRCALLMPGQTDEAYELKLWRQIEIDVESMDMEVHVEYDSATRYYYLLV
jgi:kinesin family protein 2/24